MGFNSGFKGLMSYEVERTGIRQMHTGFWSGNLSEGIYFRRQEWTGRKMYLKEVGHGTVWTELIWLRKGTGDGLL